MDKSKTDLRDEYREIVDDGLEQESRDQEAHAERKEKVKQQGSARKAAFWTGLLILTAVNVTIYLVPGLLQSGSPAGSSVSSQQAVQQKIELFQKTVVSNQTDGKELPESATLLLSEIPRQLQSSEQQRELLDAMESAIRDDLSSSGMTSEEIDQLFSFPSNNSLIVKPPDF